ncbi:MAG: hypothetical protein QOK28_1577 [Actinomycetota bacterium]
MVAALAVSEAALGVIYAARGAGYVLDDWFTLGNARAAGIWATPGHVIFVNRPGAGLLYCLVFGVFGGHPLAGLTLLTALSASTAALVFLVCRRFLAWQPSLAVAVVWAWLPNHTSLEFWQSCVPLAAATVLTLAGTLVVARSDVARRQQLLAAALFTVASLTYEAVFPIALLVLVGAPWLAGRAWSARRDLAAAALLVPAAAYLVLFRSTQKTISHVGPVAQVVPGHFGWGIVPAGPGARVLVVMATVGLAVCVARLVLPTFRATTGVGERMVAIGGVVVVAGTVPFTFYPYAPLGAGDRFTLVSSIGGAVAWVGLGIVLWRWRAVVIVGGAVLAVMSLTARVQRVDRWTTAAGDSARIARAIQRRFPVASTQRIVLGPSPVQQGDVAAFLDQSNVNGLLRYLYRSDVPGGIAYARADFERFPPTQRVDVWQLSRLHADVDLSTDHQGTPRSHLP